MPLARHLVDADHLRHHSPQLRVRLLDRRFQTAVSQRDNSKIQPLRLESVTDFGLDTAVEPRLSREGSEEETAGEGEGFHPETAGDRGIKPNTVPALLYILVIHNIAVLIDILGMFIRPKVETDARRHIDERFQFAATLKVVTVVEEQRNFLKRTGVDAVTDTQTDEVILLNGDTVHEDTGPTHILADEKAILIDEIVSNLFLLLLLSGKGAQAAANCDA